MGGNLTLTIWQDRLWIFIAHTPVTPPITGDLLALKPRHHMHEHLSRIGFHHLLWLCIRLMIHIILLATKGAGTDHYYEYSYKFLHLVFWHRLFVPCTWYHV